MRQFKVRLSQVVIYEATIWATSADEAEAVTLGVIENGWHDLGLCEVDSLAHEIWEPAIPVEALAHD